MATTTRITGNPTEFAFTRLAASLEATAHEHKRLSALHRRHAQNAMRDRAQVVSLAAQCGVTIQETAS